MTMIKGSLFCSVPIVKRLRASPKMGRKFEFFLGGVKRDKFLTLTIRLPRKSIPTEARYLAQNGVDTRKNVLSRGGQVYNTV